MGRPLFFALPLESESTFDEKDSRRLLAVADQVLAATARPGHWKQLLPRARAAVLKAGLPLNPVGGGNRKTGTPATYRPVGATCPSSCPYLGNGCYAQQGFVYHHQGNASPDWLPSATSALVAMVLAARLETVARLHVSGDLTRDDQVDRAYVAALEQLGRYLRAQLELTGPLAWTYTHLTPAQLGPWHERLKAAGIVVRFSDQLGHDGVIVAPFSEVPELRLRHPGQRLAKCLAQLTDDRIPCASCKLCWERPDLTIVFRPHGFTRHAAAAAATYSTPGGIARGHQ